MYAGLLRNIDGWGLNDISLTELEQVHNTPSRITQVPVLYFNFRGVLGFDLRLRHYRLREAWDSSQDSRASALGF